MKVSTVTLLLLILIMLIVMIITTMNIENNNNKVDNAIIMIIKYRLHMSNPNMTEYKTEQKSNHFIRYI